MTLPKAKQRHSNYIFVYGTLKKGFETPMASKFHAEVRYESEGYFYGNLFKIEWYAGATKSKDTSKKVYGHIFRMGDNIDEVFEMLDTYEEVGSEHEQPNEFKKKMIQVMVNDRKLNCWCYLYNLPTDNFEAIESGVF